MLIIDEAQEMFTNCLNELRLISSANFDSQYLLTTVICGDMRLPERFRSNALMPLGSRIRLRMIMKPYERNILLSYLEHCLAQSGAPQLMTKSLMETLVDHAGGNLRVAHKPCC